MDAVKRTCGRERTPRQDTEEHYGSALQALRGLVRAYIRRQIPQLPPEDLQDLEQDVWLAAWRSFGTFSRQAALSTWLIGVTKHILGSWLRTQHREQQRQFCLHTLQGCVWSHHQRSDRVDCIVVRDALAQLPNSQQRVLCLRYFEGLTDQEIAERTGLALGTVKGRMRSGLAHLREVL